jgi:dephospho-CoA kinase
VNLHVRVAGSPGWRFALGFRDWLTSDPSAREAYGAEKHRLAALHASDASTYGYAQDKEVWFTKTAGPGLERWAESRGWQPPSYASSGSGRSESGGRLET